MQNRLSAGSILLSIEYLSSIKYLIIVGIFFGKGFNDSLPGRRALLAASTPRSDARSDARRPEPRPAPMARVNPHTHVGTATSLAAEQLGQRAGQGCLFPVSCASAASPPAGALRCSSAAARSLRRGERMV